MKEDGSFDEIVVDGISYSGQALMDYVDRKVQNAYFMAEESPEKEDAMDFMWYLWCGAKSPVYGKGKMTTFEHYFIEDPATHKEPMNPYYRLSVKEETCDRILEEFGLDPEESHIINGHVPVKIKEGESPVKAGGKLFIIDGGLSKAYQSRTGIAGYTLIYNSNHLALAEHKPYSPLQPDGSQRFHSPVICAKNYAVAARSSESTRKSTKRSISRVYTKYFRKNFR